VRARDQIAELLPQGQRTVGHVVRTVATDSGEEAGFLWYAIRPGQLFIYDVHLGESFRGQGLGSAVMRAVEEEARRYGADEIKLSVFAHNTGAIRLYERLGYVATREGAAGMQMTKRL
jgi:ribosomal protein S18 acetylase RimI-like enzyme